MDNKIILENNNEKLVDIEHIYQDIRNKIIVSREKIFKHIDTTMTEKWASFNLVGSVDQIRLASFSEIN